MYIINGKIKYIFCQYWAGQKIKTVIIIYIATSHLLRYVNGSGENPSIWLQRPLIGPVRKRSLGVLYQLYVICDILIRAISVKRL